MSSCGPQGKAWRKKAQRIYRLGEGRRVVSATPERALFSIHIFQVKEAALNRDSAIGGPAELFNPAVCFE